MAVGVGSSVRASVSVGSVVAVSVAVGTGVSVAFGSGVAVSVGTSVGISVAVGVSVGTSVRVSVGMGSSVGVSVAERLRLDEEELTAILTALLSKAVVTSGWLHLPGVTRDPKDDSVVACAKEGEVDHIVSGDQNLLVLGEYEGIQVITPRQFVEILASHRARVEGGANSSCSPE